VGTFNVELRDLINRYGKDSDVGVADYILANYLENVLDNLVLVTGKEEAPSQTEEQPDNK